MPVLVRERLAVDGAGEGGAGLLAHQLGVFVGVEGARGEQGAHGRGLAAALAGAGRQVVMDDVLGRDAHLSVPAAAAGVVARVCDVGPVGDAGAAGVELDGVADAVAVGQVAMIADGHELRFEDLDLQRHGKRAVVGAAPTAHKDLAGHAAGAHGLGLLAAEVERALGVELAAGALPEGDGGLAELRILGARAQGHADTDLVGDEAVDRGPQPGVVALGCAGAVA